MIFRNFLQGMALIFVIGSLTQATASSLRDWEGDVDESASEDGIPRGFLEERSQMLEEDDSTEVMEVAEVVISPKQRNLSVRSRKDLAMVPVRSKRVGDITDETATTGENAKKRLPSYVRHDQPAEPSFLHEISQVTTAFMPMDLQRKAD